MKKGAALKGASRLLEPAARRLKWEYCIVLLVQPPVNPLSRFITDNERKFDEGRRRADEVIAALRSAGLTLKVVKHRPKDGAKVLMIFVGATAQRLELQQRRLAIERWLQEEGIGLSGSISTLQHQRRGGGFGGGLSSATPRTPALQQPGVQVVKVGGLHYLAPVEDRTQPPAAASPQPSPQPQPRPSPQPQPQPSPSPQPQPQPQPSPQQTTSREAPYSPGSAPLPPFNPTAAVRLELLEHILSSPAEDGGAGIEELRQQPRLRGTVLHAFPLHDPRFNRRLRRRARHLNPWNAEKREAFLEEVRAQFGEKVALYFHFNLFYTRWLLVPALLGAVLWLRSWFVDEASKGASYVLYALFIVLWAAAFIKAWQRYSHRLSMDWGTFNRTRAEVVRQKFYGAPRISPVTNERELHYPEWKRQLKCLVSAAVLAPQTILITTLIGLLYVGYIWIQSTQWSSPLHPLLLNLLNSTIWGITLEFLNFVVFYKLATYLTDFENHRTVEEHVRKPDSNPPCPSCAARARVLVSIVATVC